ncbi:TlpA family protein disulfide reductase [Mucilaginibacter terrenus]|uniref:TlpA family protein disulfide reductase n=1 Tax=Mucilaginibacter terrenus TaxID=2482727 RepID=A0A3E2NR54_9SPHI|nr:TlpA disulfide reductase family protein [Mucilaginibacter terrenus]RFZ83472.1 TlpA family protein disulfide reductase [Mucilaginibacter terrenus]
MNKRWLSKGNIWNAVLIIALLVLVFVPAAKALLIRGLMGVGLFNPDVNTAENTKAPAAPEMIFIDRNDKAISLSQLRGKVVVLNFWATWCPPCLAEMPSLNGLQQQFKGNNNVSFVMVDADGELPKSAKFMADKGYQLFVYRMDDMPGTVFAGSLPTTVVINKQGKIVFRHEGTANYNSDDMVDFIKKLSQ